MSNNDTVSSVKFDAYLRLIRLNKPVGTLLLLAPTFIALWLAAEGVPSIKNLIIFGLGVFVMRSAGCIVNDMSDKDFDKFVNRTKLRPLASGELTTKEAARFLAVLLVIALILVLMTNSLTIKLSFAALALAMVYPLMKRVTHFPQIVLGAAFSMSIPMAFAAESNALPVMAWMLFLANLCWVVAYDTQYAMADREEDLRIGVKSTAVLLGDMDVPVILFLQGCFIMALYFINRHLGLGSYFVYAMWACLLFFAYQYFLTKDREPDKCIQAFTNNQWVGLVLFFGVIFVLR